MSVHKLDASHRPIRGRSEREPLTRLVRGQLEYLFEIRVSAPANGNGRRQRCRRAWLPTTAAAEAAARELAGAEPADALTWGMAWEAFRAVHEGKRAAGHLDNQARDVRLLCEFLGDVPIESTTLARYSDWLRQREATSSGRSAQLARAHTLRVARWAASQGLVAVLPFERAPVPEARAVRRPPASVGAFFATARALGPGMRPLWLAVGYTGARISGMAGLRESAVGPSHLTVTTKGRREVSYALLPPLAQVLHDARCHKLDLGISSPYLFVTSRGTPWTHRTFDHALSRLYRGRRDLDPVRPHQLRHLWATLAAGAGFSPDFLTAALGHEDRRSAASYIHHTQEMADRVAAVVMVGLAQQAKPQGLLPAPEGN